MSRVLISTLAFGAVSLMSTSALAQPLNINPFPINKPAALSGQEEILTPGPVVEKTSKEVEKEISRLEREQELEIARQEALRKEQVRKEAQERAVARELQKQQQALSASQQKTQEKAAQLQREKEDMAKLLAQREAEKMAEEQEMLKLEQENALLAQQLAERNALEQQKALEAQAALEAKRVEEERVRALEAEKQQMQAALERQKKDAEAKALEMENAALAAQLEVKRKEEERLAALKAKEQAEAAEQEEIVSLQEQNKKLAEELRTAQEQKRKQEEREIALRVLETQKKADAKVAMEGAAQDSNNVDPLFESAAIDSNPVSMTPMPGEGMKENREVIEVSASGLGLVESDGNGALSSGALKPDEKTLIDPQPQRPIEPLRQRQISRSIDLVAHDLEVIPYPQSAGASGTQFKASEASPYRRPTNYRSAQAGESLEDVLRSWSQAEGVGFLWKTTQFYDLPNPVQGQGDYASSVEALLDQFEGGGVRPVGKLQTDPVTGMRTLSILSE